MPKVEARGLSKEYHGRYVLRDISFECGYGDLLAIVGPNGAGKTTLLRILDLLEEPTEGMVLFDGEPVDYSPRGRVILRRRIGMVFQETVLFNMSVLENIIYPLRVRGISKGEAERRVGEALRLLQLEGLEDKNALTLSGGEAQRVALAQALVAEPELLLLDEPTANLDPRSTSIVEEVLRQVNREEGRTIIMTTHNMLQAESLAKRIALLNQGRMERIGAYQEVLGAPSRPVEGFTRLENLFTGVSRITSEGTSIVDIGGGVEIEAAFRWAGNVTLHVPPEDIILSANPLISSARNIFQGRVAEIVDLGPIVKLKVRVGEGRSFTAQITKRSFREMSLNLDSKLYITFKASSVKGLSLNQGRR